MMRKLTKCKGCEHATHDQPVLTPLAGGGVFACYGTKYRRRYFTLNLSQAARLAGVKHPSIKNEIYMGRIDAVHHGRHTYVYRPDVEQYAARRAS